MMSFFFLSPEAGYSPSNRNPEDITSLVIQNTALFMVLRNSLRQRTSLSDLLPFPLGELPANGISVLSGSSAFKRV